jgi:cytochrome P450
VTAAGQRIGMPTKSDLDLFAESVLADPFVTYAHLRELGPAVYLTRHGMWFIGRYAEARQALRDWQTFSSEDGIGLNSGFNEAWDAALINLDPPAHDEQRHLFTDRLSPRALRPVRDTIEQRAAEMAARLHDRGEFDAVDDLAHDLPVHLIADLIGWPETGRERLLDMAAAWFDSGGPENERTVAAGPRVHEMIEFLGAVVASEELTPGGFGWTLLEAHKHGEIPIEGAIGLLAGYIVAAFDTTINTISSGVWLFATNPDQWAAVRGDAKLVAAAMNEVLRLESPIQCFSRVTTRDVDLDGVVIPEGSRVIVSYAAANRDGRHYPDPDRFDVRRNPIDHLAFSFGIHSCAGQGLARMEVQAVFAALARRVGSFELAGEPVRAINNLTRGFAHVPVRVS